MILSTRLILLAGFAGPMVFSGIVFADQEKPSDVPGQGLEEITVTANRREEKLQDVPISVAAFGSADLAAAGIGTSQDLAMVTPGLTMSQQSGALTPFIRGIGAVDNTVGQEAAVSTYVDGVYYPSVYGALFNFNNIDRIEVLKGPQGTLFGRNATGGLIQVVTRDPSHDAAVEGGMTYGNYGSTDAKLYGTLGVNDFIAADLAIVSHHQSNGWGHDLVTGSEVGYLPNETGVRNKWLITPGDTTRIAVSFDYLNSDNGDIGNAKNFVSGAVSTLDGLPGATGYYNTRSDMSQQFVNTVAWGGALNINQDFSVLDFQSITSHRDTKVRQQFDNDATNLVFLDAYINDQLVRTTTQEFHVSSKPASPIKWIAGLYGLWDQSGFEGPLGLGLLGEAFAPSPGVLLKNVIRTKSYAGFADGTFPVAESTNLTVGFRWTRDQRDIEGVTNVVGASNPDAPIVATIPVTPQTFTQSKPTWRVVLDHKLEDGTLLYGSYNRGFKSGNFNTVSPSDAPFKAETVDAYEIGAKTEFLDQRLRLNAALFYYDYKNLQLPSLSGSFLLTTNAASSNIKGIDLDGEYLLTTRFKLKFGASYLDTKYTSFPDAQCSSRSADGVTTQFSCDATGKELSRSPKDTAFLGAQYDIPSSVGPFSVNATYSYTGKYYWEPENRLYQSAYSLLNATATWTRTDGRFGLDAFVKNLTNRQYAVWIVGFALGDEYAAAPPRLYGVGFHFRF